ncbi:MAG: ATPase [Bacteroidales bacterium]|nr:ATPase [Bacteroidales bacterium]
MIRYSFLIYHQEYNDFLQNLQDIGVLHIAEKATDYDEETKQTLEDIKQLNEAIRFLERKDREEKPVNDGTKPFDIVSDIKDKQEEIANIEQELVAIRKDMDKAQPWGDFNDEMNKKLKTLNLTPRFFVVNEKHFDSTWEGEYYLEIINNQQGYIYFVILQEGDQEIEIEAEEVKLPSKSLSELDKEYDEKEKRIQEINRIFNEYAEKYLELLRNERKRLQEKTDFNQALNHTEAQAEDKVMLLEGWVPDTKEEELRNFLEKENVLYVKSDVKDEDPKNVPVLLKNNKFAKVFQPLQGMIDLPHYRELDLTPFFAPFFALFFGFCLGDVGYGIVILAAVTLYKHTKAKEGMKLYLTMAQYLGGATVLMGIIGGTVFGMNLTDFDWATQIKNIVLNRDQLFNLSLALGVLQILFGMTLKAYRLWKFYGFQYALSTFGWILALVSLIVYMGGDQLGWFAASQAGTYFNGVLILSGILIFFFSDPTINIFARIGKGVWDAYNTITGVFGDVLSYIRLFAIGISTAILGFVINEIALTFGEIPYVGPVVFVLILVIGHIGNLLISSLSSFVHPMRLTFVEFYNNAGFSGGGKKYKPFTKSL